MGNQRINLIPNQELEEWIGQISISSDSLEEYPWWVYKKMLTVL